MPVDYGPAEMPTRFTSRQANLVTRAPARTISGGIPAGVGLGAGAGIVGPVNVDQPRIQQAIGAIPAVAGALGVTLPAGLLTGLGVAGAAYGLWQGLGGGEGGGLFDNNLLGGDEFVQGGLEFGGPGLAEPLQPYTEWHTGNKQFYHVPQYTQSGAYKNAKIAMYNKDTGKWKVWTLPKPHLAVIGKNMPRHQMITRLRRNLSRHTADAKTILKLTSPNSLESTRRGGGKWVKGRKRYID